ncbi:MAG: hypothetical protein EA348_02980 [Pseudomonadaceae bacterium]|nr:MAG: hypothetical protein EA348_02980 [Pseudomonadaceae bacterium]
MKKTIYVPMLLAATLLLAACSSGPSESDIQALLESEINKMSAAMGELGGDEMSDMLKVDIHSVKIHSCEEERTDVYLCDVEIDATSPLGGRSTERSMIMLAKSDDGWIQAQ